MRREAVGLIFGRLIPALIGLWTIFAHLFDRMNSADATYFLSVSIFLLVMEHVLNGGERCGSSSSSWER